jgi:hypothetical protein
MSGLRDGADMSMDDGVLPERAALVELTLALGSFKVVTTPEVSSRAWARMAEATSETGTL